MKRLASRPPFTISLSLRSAGDSVSHSLHESCDGLFGGGHLAEHLTLLSSLGFAIDRNVRLGVGCELGPGPVRVPCLQLEPGELRHQVEFSRPDIAVWATEELRLSAITEVEMVGDDELLHDVVSV